MATPLIQIVRSRWLAITVHLGFWLLAFFTLSLFGGRAPQYRESVGAPAVVEMPIPVHKLDKVFAGSHPVALAPSNSLSPFFTTHFVPPPTPAPAPPPTTRKVQIVYQGYFESSDHTKHAVLKVSTNFVFATLGSRVETNLFVADATIKSLMLTNLNTQTNLLPLNVVTTLEVPLP